MNQVWVGSGEGFGSDSFNSLLGFSSFESLQSHGPSAKCTSFNSLLGFSSFESDLDIYALCGEPVKLSIPYWDFLVLNQDAYSIEGDSVYLPFNSLLGFSSFESAVANMYCVVFVDRSFNSLLGFSSFESSNSKKLRKNKKLSFNSLLGFSSFES